MQPFAAEVDPAELAAALQEIAEAEGEEPEEPTQPGQTSPDAPGEKIDLTADQETALLVEIPAVLDSYDKAMAGRLGRWRQINDAYNLYPDPARSGEKPDASRLVSELLRSRVNIATSRIYEMIAAMTPLVKVQATDDQGKDAQTSDVVSLSRSLEDFFEGYTKIDLKIENWLPLVLHRSVRLGSCIVRSLWAERMKRYFYRAEGKKGLQLDEEIEGFIETLVIPNEDFVVWPIWKNEIEEMDWVGHRSRLSPQEFTDLARRLELDSRTIDQMLTEEQGAISENAQADLKGKDLKDVTSPYSAEIQVLELWGRRTLKGDEHPTSLRLFYSEQTQRILRIEHNPCASQRYPFAHIAYWPEDGVFWASGVGHEVLYNQAADDAMLNMRTDNLKIIGNHLRLIKAGRNAETMMHEIAPGADIVTEEPKEDVLLLPLGGDLSHIYQAQQDNEMRATKSTGITAPLQGMGDPTMKSGASPSSIQMLITEAGKKFGHVDRSIRRGLTEMYVSWLETLQQFAPDGLFYKKVSPEKAEQLVRIRFMPPRGKIREMFRLSVQAPSAAANSESQKQNGMILYQLVMQHAQTYGQMAAEAFGDNPAGLAKYKREYAIMVHELYLRLLEAHDYPGLLALAPKAPEVTPEIEQMNQLIQQLQQAQQQNQQLQMQMQQMQQMMQPQAPPAAGGF